MILEGVECAVADRTAVWVPRAAASELRAAAPDSLGGADLVALSETGFLLFDRPICATSLGNGGPLGISPINGVIWWAAAFDGNTFDYCPAEPNVVMVHVLSTTVSPDSPWGPQIWEGSTLSDIGVFLLPVGGHLAGPPASVEDDLTPLIELLFGFGVAACEFGLQASA
ncbi:hypothetical protein [Gordonia hirsuta]|uniref:hypothetical protein n=1 Tax=Gordonia hirsuta TaxID=53427 RepID=UPI0012DF48A4|nr:hypothetical protein [Gordonia hirsuta]